MQNVISKVVGLIFPNVKKNIKTLHALGISLIDFLVLLYYNDKKKNIKPNNSTKKKVLIIRLDAIGDAIIWLDSLRMFKTLYPPHAYDITLLCNIVWIDLVKDGLYVDNCIGIDRLKFKNNLTFRYQQFKKISKQKYDIVINAAYSRQFLVDDSIVRASSAFEKIGHCGDYSSTTQFQNVISNAWYSRLVVNSEKNLMEIGRNAELMHGLGLSQIVTKFPELLCIRNKKPTFDKYYVIFPGASSPKKSWPIENYSLLCKKIYDKYKIPGYICGSVAELALGKSLMAFTGPNVLCDLTGKTTLLELCEIIRNAKILISNDTSAAHISVAVSTPLICMLGGGHYGRFLPYKVDDTEGRPIPKVFTRHMQCFGCNWNCICKNKKWETWPCISGINVDDVWNYIVGSCYFTSDKTTGRCEV